MDTPFPIVTLIQRELLTSLRSWKSFGLLLVMLLLLLYAASETMDASVMYTTASAAMQLFFNIQIWCLYLMAMAVVPAMAAVSINSERESGNWDLLATSLIPPSRIVLGKYIAVLVYFLLYGIAVLPLAGLVYFYAGVDLYQFFDAVIWIVPAALCNAAIGLWASATCPKPAQSVIRTFSSMFLLAAFFMLFGVLRRYLLFAGAAMIPPLFTLFGGSGNAYAAYQLVAGALFLAVTLYLTRTHTGAIVSAARSVSGAVQRTRAKLFTPPQWAVPDGANPFGYRDLFGNRAGNRWAARLLFAGTAAAYFAMFTILHRNLSGAEAGMGLIERLVILALAPPLVAISVAKERDDTTMDMYRMTLRSSADFLTGKVLGFLRQYRPVLLAVLCCKSVTLALFMADIGLNEYGPPLQVLVTDFLTLPAHLLLVICTAIAGALFPRSTIAAIGAAFGFIFGGMLFFLYLQFKVLEGVSSANDIATAIGFTVGHLVLCFLALMVAVGVGAARISALWDARG